MGLLDLSSVSTHVRTPASSLPPRLRNFTTKVFVPVKSSSHLSLSSSAPLRNQSSTIFLRSKDQNSSIKVTSDKLAEVAEDNSPPGVNLNFLDLAVRLIRPYILYGTLITFLGITGRVFVENPQLTPASLLNLSVPLKGLLILTAMFGVDAYNMIINLISDVKIDRINKPYLPLASGEISLQQAWSFVIGSAIHSIATAALFDRKALLPFVLLDLFIGTIYSVHPFYTKRRTAGAILTCAAMRGFSFSFMVWAGSCATLGVPFQVSPALIFHAIFGTLISGAASIMKDFPDREGDKKYNMKTLALVWGPEKASYVAFGLIFSAFAGPIAAAICLPGVFRSSVVIPAHLLVGSYVMFKAWKLVKENYSQEESKSFFQLVWKLLDVGNVVLPFI